MLCSSPGPLLGKNISLVRERQGTKASNDYSHTSLVTISGDSFLLFESAASLSADLSWKKRTLINIGIQGGIRNHSLTLFLFFSLTEVGVADLGTPLLLSALPSLDCMQHGEEGRKGHSN